MDFKQSGHLDPALTDSATRTLRTDKLTGRWLNTNPDTQGILECVIEQDGELFNIDVFGAGTSKKKPANVRSRSVPISNSVS